jgi:hypothetical protein
MLAELLSQFGLLKCSRKLENSLFKGIYENALRLSDHSKAYILENEKAIIKTRKEEWLRENLSRSRARIILEHSTWLDMRGL